MKKIMAMGVVIAILMTGCKGEEPLTLPIKAEALITKVQTSVWDEQDASGAYDLRGKDLSSLDLSFESEALFQSSFDETTQWSSRLPADYNPNKVFENGKNPGLSIRSLHESGITGKSVGIAMIDTGLFPKHQEYAKNIVHYEKLDDTNSVYLDSSVANASIMVGEKVGVAPGATFHYFDIGSKAPDQAFYAKAIQRVVDYSADLNVENKIRLIVIPELSVTSDTLSKPLKTAIESARTSEIEVLYLGAYPLAGIGRHPKFHPDYTGGYETQAEAAVGLSCPASSRTLPIGNATSGYQFVRHGNNSWALSFVAGVYALSLEVKPDATLDEVFKLALEHSESVQTEGGETLSNVFNAWEYFNALSPDYAYAWKNENYGSGSKEELTLKETLLPMSPFATAEPYTLYKANQFDASAFLKYTYDTTNVFEGSESIALEIIEKFKNPGLGVRSLHARGIKGKNVNVGIIDQYMLLDHPEYKDQIRAYYNVDTVGNYDEKGSYHGPAVTSILAGKTTGVAPEVGIYFAAAPSWHNDAQYFADALYWMIEENEKLEGDEKIRIVSVSAAPSSLNNWFKNGKAWTDAVAAAEAKGIYVIDCRGEAKTGFVYGAFSDGVNIEEPSKYLSGFPDMQEVPSQAGIVLAPASLRTFAQQMSPDEHLYRYEASGGQSWAVPYVAGVFALGWQVDPSATGDELRALMLDTAAKNNRGHKVVDPVAFVEAVELLKNK